MNKRFVTTLAASALVAGTAAAGIASAADRAAADAKAATASAARAGKALAKHDAADAVAAAEAAVGLAPHDAGYRVLLGQSYLAAGRFVSARDAFGDALSLAPTNGKAALNLVLSQIAIGDWGAARRTLDEHGAVISPADRGLALALAGDPAGGVQLLTQVARSSDTSPKVRQNLALALALAGDWPMAKTVAAADLSPNLLDTRLAQWAAFAHPHAAADQVATLLGVTAVDDHGQPAALALVGAAPVAVAAVAAPVAPIVVAPAPAPVAATTTPAVEAVAAADPVASGPSVAVVPPLQGKAPVAVAPAEATRAAPMIAAPAKPIRVAVASTTSHGTFFVQLGAFHSSAVAHDAWNRATRRMPALAKQGPNGTNFTLNKTSFYRLSVGGFARPQADALCRRYRAIGGSCFVRAGAGDQVAAWVKKGAQLAAR